MAMPDLIDKYGGAVPRYTSYPTAPHFSPAVTAVDYRSWLQALPGDAELSLYLHVPFCDELCLYCGCTTSVVRLEEPRQAYAAALCREIDLVADAVGRRARVRHIHFGGGTPTALPAASLLDIMEWLRCRFDMTEDAEIAIELDPRHLSAEHLAVFPTMGITRASLGVQDFNESVQEAVGRRQSFAVTERAARMVRAHGATSLNLDLMYGLPLQTPDSVAATAAQALSLAPDRIAVFGYAHVPWMKRHQALIPESSLPNARDRQAQLQVIETILERAGYMAIGLDHFAKPHDAMARAAAYGTLRRNFQGYTTDSADVLLAFGASAIGALPQGYIQNAAKTPAYLAALRSNQLATERGHALTADDKLRADIIQHIMCSGRVDVQAMAAAHERNVTTLHGAQPRLRAMADDGLITWNGRLLEVTQDGRRFRRSIAAAFDAYLADKDIRFSQAV